MAYFKRLFSCKFFLEIDSFSQQAKNGEVRKSGRIENILISLIFVWLRVKSGGMEKMSLYKFTHIPLLKNDAQLKQKVTSNQKTKSPKLY